MREIRTSGSMRGCRKRANIAPRLRPTLPESPRWERRKRGVAGVCNTIVDAPGRRPRMNENELFQAALGLLPPWVVSRCTFDEAAGRLDISLSVPDLRGCLEGL